MKIGFIDFKDKTCAKIKAYERSVDHELIFISYEDLLQLGQNAFDISKFRGIDYFFVNVEIEFQNSKRSELKGIDSIYILRLKYNITSAIICCGFLSLEQILQLKPQAIVINAPGNYYLRLPYNIKDFNEFFRNSYSGIDENILLEKYSSFVKPAFDITGIRHKLGNVYGGYYLNREHNLIYGIHKDSLIIPEAIFSQFNPVHLCIAEFLKNKADENEDDLNSEILKVQENRAKLLGYRKHNREKPNILYIDDKANNGWAYLFEKIIFDTVGKDNFKVIIPKPTVPINNNKICKTIFDDNIDCVLLDLRLKDEVGMFQSVNDLSGAKLLKIIKKRFPHLPVIIVTASNKAYSVKNLIDLGAESLWTKPNIDEIRNKIESVFHYSEFVKLVLEALTKFKYPIQSKQFKLDKKIGYWNSQHRERSKIISRISSDIKIYDYVVFDTNFFMEDRSGINNLENLYKLSLLNKPKICIIDDVLAELFLNTHKNLTINFTEQDRIRSSYGLEHVLNRKADKKVLSLYQDIDQLIEQDYFIDIDQGEGKERYVIKSLVTKCHGIYNNENSAQTDIEDRINKRRKTLHADDTFVFLLEKLLFKKEKNVLFVSNDKGCKTRIFSELTINYYPNIVNEERDSKGRIKYAELTYKNKKSTLMENRMFNTFFNEYI